MDGRSLATDKISNLPSDVLDHILKRLPLCDAIKTSVLSKGWRYKWVTIPYLIFDRSFSQPSLKKYNPESIIFQVLLLHKGPILKFRVHVSCSFPAVDHCLHFLANKCVEELDFIFPYSETPRIMSRHLYSFDNLTHLDLCFIELRSPPSFKGFNKLVKLVLNYCYYPPGEFGSFISKCPVLEYLKISCDKLVFGNHEIDAPNLKSFTFKGGNSLISFKNAPLLENVELIWYGDYIFPPHENGSYLMKVFSQLSAVNSVKLHGGFLEFLSAGGVPDKFPNNLNHLRLLHLLEFNITTLHEVACVICLLRSSPNLQSLIVDINDKIDDYDETTSQFLKAEQNNRNISLCRLKNVKIDGFRGTKPEMEFVKILLSTSTILREMKFRAVFREASCGFNMLKELIRFPRASPTAEIIFGPGVW